MSTSFYWFDSKNCKFYGPATSHAAIIDTNIELAKIIDDLLNKSEDKGLLYDLLLDDDFVRLYYNHDNSELGISCIRNKSSLKTVRNFIKKESFPIESLFLDVNDIGIQTGLIGKDIDLYIKFGRINSTQNV